MRVGEALGSLQERLSSFGVDEARLEAELMMMRAMNQDRVGLYCLWDKPLSSSEWHRLVQMERRRQASEPIAYILGEREFFGLSFLVGPGVFIPRQETELLVEEAMRLLKGNAFPEEVVLADVGTGSGAIAIALAAHMPRARIYAIDVSPSALAFARRSAERHGVAQRVVFLEGDLLEPLPERANVVVANLPYVTDEEHLALAPEIRLYEPAEALTGGKDGLDLYRRLLPTAGAWIARGGHLILEMNPSQRDGLVGLAQQHLSGCQVRVLDDLAGLARAVEIGL